MRFLYTSCIFVILIGALAAIPFAASAEQTQSSDEVISQDVPDGFIVVKLLPAGAASGEHSNMPRRITDRRDPEYVRCRLESVAGSALKKRQIRMTSREWKLAIRKGNQYAPEFVGDNQTGIFQ